MENQQDETTSLLPQQQQRPTRHSPRALPTIISTAVAILTLNVGSYIALVPTVAILESIICKKFYENTPISPIGDHCKVEAVQSEVAYINGWKDAFEMVPAILLAVPYGALADRIGRKKVFLLAVLGCFVNDVWIRLVFWFPNIFSVRAVWLGGIGQVIGAGAATLTSMSFVLVADVCSPEQRTIAFSYIKSAMLLSQLIFLPLGGTLVAVDPWIPMLASCGFTIAGFLIALVFISETMPSPADVRRRPSTKVNLSEVLRSPIILGQLVSKHLSLALISICFFLYHFGEQASGSLLLQYASKRLHWSLGKASLLLSLGAGLHLFVLMVLLPAISTFLLHRVGLHEMAKDKRLAQLSGGFLIAGSGLISIATSLSAMITGQVFFSMGYFFQIAIRSFVTGMVEPSQLGALFTIVAVFTYIGSLSGAPFFAWAFKLGMQLGGIWVGMPFFIAGTSFGVALLVVSIIGTKDQTNDTDSGSAADTVESDLND
ncbi:MFS general substrate transporter [Xylaria telfairii]|nr:MFS general substrate transporter [Xylaria telfairii]